MKPFLGTWRLIRLALRRDRIVLPTTIVLTSIMVGASAPALVDAYPSYEDQLTYVASSVPTAFGRVFQGTIQGVSLGSILTAETFLFTAVILALMSIFIISRHTRYNEEIGAGELIGSTITGRGAPLTAALIVAIGANIAVALLIFAMLAGVPELDKTGSAFFATGLALTGIFFAGISAVTVQLSDYRRGANAMAVAVLTLTYLVQGYGNAIGTMAPDGLSVSASWITWLSPFGWTSQVLPYYDNALLPLLLLLGGFIILVATSYCLLSKRDLGSSIFESRPGRERAKKNLLRRGGLTRKLQHGGFLGWGAGFIITGAFLGAIVTAFQDIFVDNELFKTYLSHQEAGQNYTEIVLASMIPMMVAMLSGYAVTAMSKVQDEEDSGRLEQLAATMLSKTKWLMSHVLTISAGIIALLFLMGLGTAVTYKITAVQIEVSAKDIMLSSLANIPAMLLFMSVILLVFALRGRFVKTFAWLYYAYCALIGTLVGIFKWPSWSQNLSPFYHTPTVPSANVDWQPVIVMTIIAIAVIAISILMFRKRDLNLK